MVELFPKLQLLDMEVYPDRAMVDFSFSRELSIEELKMLKARFLQKIEAKEEGDIREMVSKNACDLLKYHKQIFLTDLVDREEMFAEMFCMDPYHAPLRGDLDQGASFGEVKLDMFEFGAKKWMKKKVHHYRLEAMFFFSMADRKKWEGLASKEDHQVIGKKKDLFWVEDGVQFFSGKGEAKFQDFVDQIAKNFGEKVFFDGDIEDFQEISSSSDFYLVEKVAGNFGEISYGLKELEQHRVFSAWSFTKKDLKKSFTLLMEDLKLLGSWNGEEFLSYDFLGIPWCVAEFEGSGKYFSITINLQCLFALDLEKKLVE
ncbi:hypothetical protein K0U07_00765 [bacterium]|nr:hypothetical protein [bacterium]